MTAFDNECENVFLLGVILCFGFDDDDQGQMITTVSVTQQREWICGIITLSVK